MNSTPYPLDKLDRAILQRLPALNAAEYAQWQQRAQDESAAPVCGSPAAAPPPARPADLRRGQQALHQHACSACHSIPGVTGSPAFVGPPLDTLARRTLIAGTLPMSQENLALWLMHTQKVKPGTAMPNLQLATSERQELVRWLMTLQ